MKWFSGFLLLAGAVVMLSLQSTSIADQRPCGCSGSPTVTQFPLKNEHHVIIAYANGDYRHLIINANGLVRYDKHNDHFDN